MVGKLDYSLHVFSKFCGGINIKSKSYLKPIYMLSKCSSFRLTTYLSCLVDVCFNRESAYLCVQTVLLFLPTSLFIRTRQIHTGASKEKLGLLHTFTYTCYGISVSQVTTDMVHLS